MCKQKEATSFSWVRSDSPPHDGHWIFSCECTCRDDIYAILLDTFFASPSATVDWMAHMHEKSWMDWHDFMEMMTRFQTATGSMGSQ